MPVSALPIHSSQPDEVKPILIVTDAWKPQVNGVVRTLQSLAATAPEQGAQIGFLTPEGFPRVALPTYRSIRCAVPSPREIARRIE
jgi:1,2-diacylglycerol 3-alpha-glucosyltransferase/glucuronosyltransferase